MYPLLDCKVKLLTLTDVAEAVKDIETDLILRTAVPKPEIDYLKEMITKSVSKPDDVSSIDDIFFISSNIEFFFENLQQIMTPENIMNIEKITIGQSENLIGSYFENSL